MLDNKMYTKAYEKYAAEQYEDALHLVQECKKQLRKKSFLYKNDDNQLEQELQIKLFEGRIHLKLDDIDSADAIFSNLEEKLKGNLGHASRTRAEFYYYRSEIAKKQENDDQQLEYLWQAKREFEDAGHIEEAVDLMYDLATITNFEDGKDGLVNHYKDIIELTKSVNDKDLSRYHSARARLEIGYLLRNGDPKVASQFLILAHKDFEKLNNTTLKYRSLIQLADIKSITDIKRASKILEKSRKEIKEDNPYWLIMMTKLTSFYLRASKFDKAMECYKQITDKFKDAETSIQLANACLETAKSFLLVSKDQEFLHASRDLAETAVTYFDNMDQKIGKAIAYLIQGLASYRIEDNGDGSSKLKLVQFMAKKIGDEDSYDIDPWVNKMVRYLGSSDTEVDEIISKLSISDDTPTMMQNAEILHLLGLYKLSDTDPQTAKTLLTNSKTLYEATRKTGNYPKIAEFIDKTYIDV